MDIDDTIICERCGKEEARRGKNQRYCKECAHESILEKQRQRWRERRMRMLYEQAIASEESKEQSTKTLLCDICGIEIERHSWNQRYCPDCAELARKKSVARYKRTIPAITKPEPQKPRVKRKPKLTISQVVRLAREAGMTYGQYVAMGNEKNEPPVLAHRTAHKRKDATI